VKQARYVGLQRHGRVRVGQRYFGRGVGLVHFGLEPFPLVELVWIGYARVAQKRHGSHEPALERFVSKRSPIKPTQLFHFCLRECRRHHGYIFLFDQKYQ
jgi:hypothetical protein